MHLAVAAAIVLVAARVPAARAFSCAPPPRFAALPPPARCVASALGRPPVQKAESDCKARPSRRDALGAAALGTGVLCLRSPQVVEATTGAADDSIPAFRLPSAPGLGTCCPCDVRGEVSDAEDEGADLGVCDATYRQVYDALTVGYRFIDTASHYNNEVSGSSSLLPLLPLILFFLSSFLSLFFFFFPRTLSLSRLRPHAPHQTNHMPVGKAVNDAIAAGRIGRADVCVCTKIWFDDLGFDSTLKSVAGKNRKVLPIFFPPALPPSLPHSLLTSFWHVTMSPLTFTMCLSILPLVHSSSPSFVIPPAF